MKFVDRIEEMQRLDALAARGQGGLAVVYGRRRVGKTRLLLEWSRKHDGMYTVADQSTPDIQRRYFAAALASRFPVLQESVYPDWRALLRVVAHEAAGQRWKGPLILDELPYLAAASPELPSVLQQWVDHEARQAGLLTALAGSSQRMMQGLVLDGSAPLFGRAHEMMELKPIALGYLGEGSGICNPVELVKHYAVWGGIPRYWEIAEPFGERLDAAVDRCVLAPLSPLHREPDRLLLDEIPPALALRPILDAIGLGAHRLTEISARIGQPATSLGRPLLRLMGMGLVRRDTPFGEPEKSAKRALYRIADPFMRLWFRIVAPHRALLAEAPAAVRMGMWNAARTDLYAAAWEEVCRMAIAGLAQVKPQLRRYGAWMPGGRFWCGNGPEWDVVSRTVDGKALLLGEVKWSERPFPPADLKRLATALVAKGVPPVATAHPQRILHALFVPRAQATPELLGAVQVIQAEDVLPCLR